MTTPDGLDLPVGTTVCVSALLAHHDEEWYPNAAAFDPYRHVQATPSSDTSNSAYTVSEKFLTFGYGTHVSDIMQHLVESVLIVVKTCPGRWLAVAETKIIVARLLTTYDFQPIAKPKPLWVGTMMVPSQLTKIMARPRQGKMG